MAKKLTWNSDKIIGISAMSISFITLIIFIYQTNLMSKQNYLSILPYLGISTSNNPANNNYAISLDNFGVGPAIIESVSLTYMGKTEDLANYNNHLLTYLQAKVPALDSLKSVSYSTLDKGLAIPAGTNYNIVAIHDSAEEYELFITSLEAISEKGFYYEITYRSIQDERWVINDTAPGPEKLD